MLARRLVLPLVALGVLLLALACSPSATSTPTPAPTATATPTFTPTPAPTPTATLSATATPTRTPTPGYTATPTNGHIPTPTPPATPTPAPAATPTPPLLTPSPQPAFPMTVTDSLGRNVVIERAPKRIIAYDAAAVEILYSLGAADRIVATHSFVHYPAATAGIEKVGDAFNVNLERVAALKPDLFFIFFDKPVPDIEKLGIKVLYLKAPADIKEVYDRIRMWGRITETSATANSIVANMQSRVDALTARLASVTNGPRVLHDVGDRWTPGKGTFQAKLYEMLKAQNIAGDVTDWAQLSTETIVARDPEVIIEAVAGGAVAIRNDAALKNVTAVKQGRVYDIDADLVDIPGPRIVDGLEMLERLLYGGS